MCYEEALAKLGNHAFSLSGGEVNAHEGFLDRLYRSERNGWNLELEPVYDDIIECLEVVNCHLNGPIPSQNISMAKFRPLDWHLVHIMSTIIHSGWEYYLKWQSTGYLDDDARQQFARICWAISFAWDQILAGDIDSLQHEISIAGKAQGLIQ